MGTKHKPRKQITQEDIERFRTVLVNLKEKLLEFNYEGHKFNMKLFTSHQNLKPAEQDTLPRALKRLKYIKPDLKMGWIWLLNTTSGELDPLHARKCIEAMRELWRENSSKSYAKKKNSKARSSSTKEQAGQPQDTSEGAVPKNTNDQPQITKEQYLELKAENAGLREAIKRMVEQNANLEDNHNDLERLVRTWLPHLEIPNNSESPHKRIEGLNRKLQFIIKSVKETVNRVEDFKEKVEINEKEIIDLKSNLKVLKTLKKSPLLDSNEPETSKEYKELNAAIETLKKLAKTHEGYYHSLTDSHNFMKRRVEDLENKTSQIEPEERKLNLVYHNPLDPEPYENAGPKPDKSKLEREFDYQIEWKLLGGLLFTYRKSTDKPTQKT